MKVLVIGPSDTGSRGGMATVIAGIRDSKYLNKKFEIEIHPSYIDGNLMTRFSYSVFAFVKFLLTYKRYDLFHIHTASFGSTFRKRYYLKKIKKAGKKAIIHIHGAKYLEFYENLNEKKKHKVADFLKQADLVLALSEDWKEKFEKTIGICNCEVLNNGIDTETLGIAVCDTDKNQNKFVLLGRLGERKGAYDLVNAVELAVKKNPSIKVYMAGDGEIDKVKAQVKEKHLEKNIDVVGWVDFNGKMELLKKVSTVVLPSYNEGLPMAILEGMAAGKAIISTTVGAIPEVVTDENGFIMEPGDVKALAEALVVCSTDAELLRRISMNNIEKANSCLSMKKMHEILSGYYKQVCDEE